MTTKQMASKRLTTKLLFGICLSLFSLTEPDTYGQQETYDLVVYGGTSAGVAAGVQAARMGRSVVILEPGQHLGGLTSGGLGATDIGNKAAIGGISREFYRRVARHYATADAWKFQRAEEYASRRGRPDDQSMWTFEPHVAERIMRNMVADVDVHVLYGKRLERTNGLEKQDGRIMSITMESGETFSATMFVDATYEGDLLALAGVSYHVGREGNHVYGETFNGVQTVLARRTPGGMSAGITRNHNFTRPIDPFVNLGDPSSGLLQGIQPEPPGDDGTGDHRIQAYNFRMCLTDVEENRLPFPKPDGYDPQRYELLLRYLQAGVFDVMRLTTAMPNRKTDTNNYGGFSSDNIGMNYAYPDGDYATRERIFRDHVTYQQGMMWFLANDPRVPQEVRDEVGRWGLCKDEFVDNGGWPHQLYVREARRMIADTVMTEHHCLGNRIAEKAVGLAAYGMDSHNTQRYAAYGIVRNEGNVEVRLPAPYPITYNAIVPKKSECGNLLVPVCVSASHIAFGSIRMEPVFMVLGQSAATAASLAIERDVPVQDVDYEELRARLLADGQVLDWVKSK